MQRFDEETMFLAQWQVLRGKTWRYKEDAVLTEDCGKKQRSNCHSFRLSALLTEVIQHPQYFGTWQEFHRSLIRFGLNCGLLYENTVHTETKGKA